MLRSSPLSCRHTCLSERQVGCGLGGSVCSDTPVLKLAVSIQGVGGGWGLSEGRLLTQQQIKFRGQVQLQKTPCLGLLLWF